jgi:HlyD family secretion protein
MIQRAILIALALVAASCSREPATGSLQGYVEGEFLLLAASTPGVLDKLNVQRGQQVAQGERVFELEHSVEQAAQREAAQRVRSAEARAVNLRSSRRPPEIEASTAQAEQAKAARRLSELQLERERKLFDSGFTSTAQFDAARATYERDIARVSELEAQSRLAKESVGRGAEIGAQQAEVDVARAALEQAESRLSQRGAVAPAPGLVQDVYFRPGEWVPAGRPVVSLLPAQNVKVRFFVHETQLGAIKPGDAIRIACDGCSAPIAATISFISSQAEYTPPVIYSQGSREKLVYMVEARPAPADAAKLRPGQPVDVTLAGK